MAFKKYIKTLPWNEWCRIVTRGSLVGGKATYGFLKFRQSYGAVSYNDYSPIGARDF